MTAVEATFPPQRHLLRDLRFEVTPESTTRHTARYSPAGEGSVALGGLLTVVDLVAGTLCLRSIAPDWMATSSLGFHLAGPLPVGDLGIEAEVLRAGRSSITVEVVVSSGGRRCGEGVVSFSRLVRREGNLSLDGASMDPGDRFSFTAEDPDPIGRGSTLRDALGCQVVDPASGATSTPVVPYLRNSFGAVNGGAVTAIVEAAALARAALELRGPATSTDPSVLDLSVLDLSVTDLVVHYLAQGRTGPVTTTAEIVRSTPSGCRLRVEVRDAGEGDRLMALAHVGVVPAR